MESYKGAEAFLEILNARGVENIFFNPGIDTVPIQVTISRYQSEGKPAPKLVLCLDESVAMAAAHGNYMVSGRPQVVFVHRELGTFQVGGAMHNAYFGRVPVVLVGGIATPDKRTTWEGNPYDQGSIVRNCVKWDHEVKTDENIGDAAQKALDIAFTEPCGPVYLAPLFEAFANEQVKANKPISEFKAPVCQPVDTGLIEKAADILLAAKSPLILVGHSGRHPQSVASLVELAEAFSPRVFTSQVRVNFPTEHPLCAGYDPNSGGNRANGHYISDADVVLLIDYDLPYAAGPAKPGPDAKVICIDIDPQKKVAPTWDRKPDVLIVADCRDAVPALTNIIQNKITPAKREQIQRRAEQFKGEHRKMRDERRSEASSKSNQKPISPDWLSYCLAQVIEDDTIIVNQTITHSTVVGEQIPRNLPGTFLSCAGGSIGWPLGAGLGAKIAAPDKTVLSLMGDGAFVWGCPVATLWTAARYQAPFLSVIFNNQAYAAIKGLVQRAYGVEKLSPKIGFESGVDIAMPPDYAVVARACGAYGKTVEDPNDILPSLKEALKQVKNGKAAVLDVRLV